MKKHKLTTIATILILAIIAWLVVIQIVNMKPGVLHKSTLYSKAKPLREKLTVRYMPNWYHEAEFMGFYSAKIEGFYEDINLDVRILSCNPDYNVPESLDIGVVDFATISPSCLAASDREGLDIVAIAAIFQIQPGVFIVMNNGDIESPKDFAGKSIITKNASWALLIGKVAENIGLNPEKIVMDTGAADIGRFLKGEVDIWTGYVHDEPVEVEMAGYDSRIFYLFDYGINDYAGVIFTRRNMVEERPDIVRAFLSATLRGWDYAIRNPENGLETVMAYAPGLSIDFQRRAINRLSPFVKCGRAPIGWIDTSRWNSTSEKWGIKEPDKLVDDRFIREIYRENGSDEDVQLD